MMAVLPAPGAPVNTYLFNLAGPSVPHALEYFHFMLRLVSLPSRKRYAVREDLSRRARPMSHA